METLYFSEYEFEGLKWNCIMHILKTFNVHYTWRQCPCNISVYTENQFILHSINAVWKRCVVEDEQIII